jgi:hypothetical protein
MNGIRSPCALYQIPRVQRYQSQPTVGPIAAHKSANEIHGRSRPRRAESDRGLAATSVASVTVFPIPT